MAPLFLGRLNAVAQSFETRGRVKFHTFGPGSLESIELRLWQQGRKRGNLSQATGHIMARIGGWYTVYCGMGNEHTVQVFGTADGWLDAGTRDAPTRRHGRDDEGANVLAAWAGDSEAAGDLAHQLIEYALEDWSDPCDDVGGWVDEQIADHMVAEIKS